MTDGDVRPDYVIVDSRTALYDERLDDPNAMAILRNTAGEVRVEDVSNMMVHVYLRAWDGIEWIFTRTALNDLMSRVTNSVVTYPQVVMGGNYLNGIPIVLRDDVLPLGSKGEVILHDKSVDEYSRLRDVTGWELSNLIYLV